MEIWQPRAKEGSAGLIFNELRDWDKIEVALGKDVAHDWIALDAKIAKGKPRDFVQMGTLLVCGNEAWQLLENKLKNEVQPLPIKVGELHYYILNVTNIVDCLDTSASRFLRTPFDATGGEIIKYVFQQDKLVNTFLFAIPQMPKIVFATSAFKDLVEGLQLQDITFQKPASPLEGLIGLMHHPN
jgi:hypothetical protein